MFKVYEVIFISVLFCSQVHGKCELRQSYGLLKEIISLKDLANLSSDEMSGRKTGSIGNLKARRFLQARFKKIGLAYFQEHSEYTQSFPFLLSSENNRGFNIVGWLKGTKFANKFIVVIAHYDHLGAKGRHVYYGAF